MSTQPAKNKAHDYNAIVLKAWKDDAYRKRFESNPKAVLAEEGWTLPAGIEVKVEKHASNVCVFGLPAKPAGVSDDGLYGTAYAAACCCCC